MSKNIKEDQTISILGPTATGKTALALKIGQTLLDSKKIKKVHLLSADSRQIYKELEILTGADIPKNWIPERDKNLAYPFFTNPKNNICLHGVKIISAKDEWSAAHFKKLFENLKKNIKNDEKIIIVGGTGFYHRQIETEAETLSIKPNFELRNKLENKTVSELQELLKKSNPKKLNSMNNSDINNPRRLIRAIEIAQNPEKNNSKIEKTNYPKIYLSLPKEKIAEKIKKRVGERFDQALQEIKNLEKENLDWNSPALTSTGAKYLKQFLNNEISKKECLELWTIQELQYAKRQITWWKKSQDLIKLEATDPKLLEKALQALID